jgi:transposase
LSASSERPSATGTRERVKASRRSWPLEEKRRIVEEAFHPGKSVADVARRHGLNSNQVFNWRKLYGTQPTAQGSGSLVNADASPAGAPDGFLSIGVIAEPKDAGAVPLPGPSAPLMGHARPAMDERPGMIEIDLPCGTRLRVDALVNERALRRVLSMLRSLS